MMMMMTTLLVMVMGWWWHPQWLRKRKIIISTCDACQLNRLLTTMGLQWRGQRAKQPQNAIIRFAFSFDQASNSTWCLPDQRALIIYQKQWLLIAVEAILSEAAKWKRRSSPVKSAKWEEELKKKQQYYAAKEQSGAAVSSKKRPSKQVGGGGEPPGEVLVRATTHSSGWQY